MTNKKENFDESYSDNDTFKYRHDGWEVCVIKGEVVYKIPISDTVDNDKIVNEKKLSFKEKLKGFPWGTIFCFIFIMVLVRILVHLIINLTN
jgi:hypothetical protein